MNKPIILFLAVIGAVTGLLIGFIQSTQFANVIKRAAIKYIPGDLGVEGDFKDFKLHFFPPGVSIREPEIVTAESNIFALPGLTRIKAETLELTFLPFQMFSGDIRVNLVKVVGGQITVFISKKFLEKRKKIVSKKFIHTLKWEDFLQIRTDAISLERTHLEARIEEPNLAFKLTANKLNFIQLQDAEHLKYLLDVEINNLEMLSQTKDGVVRTIESLKGAATIDSLGVDLREFQVKNAGIELGATGKILGDVLSPIELKTDVQLQFKGELKSVFALFNEKINKQNLPSGYGTFEGDFKTDLVKPRKNFIANGKLQVDHFKYDNWVADRLALDGQFMARDGIFEMHVEQGVIESDPVPRIYGKKNALGGRIEISAFKYRVGSQDDILVGLKLTDAHLQWLTSGVADSVHSIDSKLNGNIYLNIIQKTPWLIKAKVNLKIDPFYFDNQRMGKTRPLRRILRIPKAEVIGKIEVDTNEVRFSETNVNLNKTHLAVVGKVNYKTGYDLHANGPINLEDIEEISENKIRGNGNVVVHVHGPTSRVIYDFETNLDQAFYLNLQFGKFKGHISYDDNFEILGFENIFIERDSTHITGNGYIDLSDKDKIDIDMVIVDGHIQEFATIFTELTKNLWWFPSRLRGAISGNIKVSGGVSLDKLLVMGKISGPNWEYLGERFKHVKIDGGYDKGAYLVQKVHATKRTGTLDGHISSYPEGKIQWGLSSKDLKLSDLDAIALFDVPMRGSLEIVSQGLGIGDKIVSETNAKMTEFSVRGTAYGESSIKIETSDSYLKAAGSIFGGQGSGNLSYALKVGGPSNLKMSFVDWDFSPLMLIVNPSLMQDSKLLGRLTSSMELTFSSGSIETANGNAQFNSYYVEKNGARFDLVKPAALIVREGDFKTLEIVLKGPQGFAGLELSSLHNNLTGKIRGVLDLSAVEFLTATVSQASGPVNIELDIAGNLKDPVLNGRADIKSALLKISGLNGMFENLTGQFAFKQNVMLIKSLESDFAGSRVTGGGGITFFYDRYPKLALKGFLTGNKIEAFPFQYIKTRGSIGVSGEELPYLVDGNVVIESALIKESFTKSRSSGPSQVALYLPGSSIFSESERSKFKLNIKASAEKGILVKNELFDAEFKGAFTLVNSLANPRVLGTAEIIAGVLTFKDTSFQIHNLDVNFDSATQLNPKFNFNGSADLNNLKINMYASGRASQYKVELSSSPVLPEAEILQLLALGTTQDETRKSGKRDRSANDQTEAASILLHSMDFNRDVQNKTGFKIDLEQAQDIQSGTSVFRPKVEADVSANPKIVVKRQVGKRLEFSFGSTVGVGTNAQKEINAEVKVTPGFSVIGVWDSIEATSAQQEGRTSYGVDLKVQKRFK